VIVRIGRRDPSTVYEVEVTSGIHATRPIGVPTWEDFKQRHFIDGIPLPVRPRRREQVPPPSWHEMVRAVQEAHRAFRTELIQLLTAALPGHDIFVSADHGPLRRSPGSVDWSEERFGFEITIGASIGNLPPVTALDRVSTLLEQQGWRLTQRTDDAVGGSRELFEVWVDARPLKVTVFGRSPLYRSPPEPGSAFVVEAR
jgi:hypothetical protein